METTINETLRKRIEGRVRQTLSELHVQKYIGVRADAASLRALDDEKEGVLKSLSKPQLETINSALGTLPMWSLVIAMVDEATKEQLAERESDEAVPLKELLSGAAIEGLARSISDTLADLPRPYVFSFCLTGRFTSAYRDASMNPVRQDRVVLEGSWQRGKASVPIAYAPNRQANPAAGGTKLSSFLTNAEPANSSVLEPAERVYLHLAADGFVAGEEPGETTAVAKQTLRSFVGLCWALKILRKSWAPPGLHVRTAIHQRRDDGAFSLVGSAHLTGREAKAIDELRLPPAHEMSPSDVAEQLNNLARLFSVPEIGTHIKLAGKWLFDYFTEDDAAMRVMHVAIATEVLLGSTGGEEGITKTLATRLAYLIAGSNSERTELEGEFKVLYQMRSKVVHNGHQRLSRKEYMSLRRFGELAGRVVSAEIRLSLADIA